MPKQFEKIDEHTIRVIDQVFVTKVYDYDSLLSIEKRTRQEKLDFGAVKDQELADLQEAILAAQGLGVVSASVEASEPIEEEPI